jgi:hypothetical protein
LGWPVERKGQVIFKTKNLDFTPSQNGSVNGLNRPVESLEGPGWHFYMDQGPKAPTGL